MIHKKFYLTYSEIDLNAVEFNVNQLRKLAERNRFELSFRPKLKKKFDGTQLLTVIKADAYGHGMDEIAERLDQMDVGFFGVSDIPEGIRLRQLGIDKPILLFESPLPEFAKQIVDYNLMSTVCTLDLAKALNDYALSKNKTVDIHIVVDTGMGRLGIWHEESFEFVLEVMKLRRLRVMGMMTHFPVADSDRVFTKKQIKDLYNLVCRLDQHGLIIPYIHAANSMGLAGYETHVLNLARPGLMIYGLYPHESLKKNVMLKPVMAIKSRIIFLKDVAKGRSISYGRTFLTKKPMKIAVVPIGYHDGYLRDFSNKACMVVDGFKCPVVGRVTMDQTMIDVSLVPTVKVGMEVTVMGTSKNQTVSADDLAHWADTINYEIVCNLGNRLPRVFKN